MFLHPHKVASAKDDILSGLTVALALVPEAVAFAFVAGVHPQVGLWAAVIVGFLAATLGGRPGMISGATGALAVVMVHLVAEHGVEYLFAAVVLMGALQILAGVGRLGKFMRMVPRPVMLGFVNGLAIVIFLAQLQHFQTDGGRWMQGSELYLMLGLVVLTMAIAHFLPKLTEAVPSSLVAIVTATLIVIGFGLEARQVGDLASIGGGLPDFHVPAVPFNLETLWIILPYSVILAAIGLIESLLTLNVIDDITNTRGRSNRECVAQGVANCTAGMFGTMGGCAMIGQSMININSGGLHRLSGITAALALAGFILFASGLIDLIPLAALVGVMFMVVLATFEWASFKVMGKVPLTDTLVMITVTVVTVFTDLAIAVVVGVIVSALGFAWETAKHIRAETRIDENGSKIYELHGPLFFASTTDFKQLFDAQNDPSDVIVEFRDSRVMDHSAIEAIDTVASRYRREGKQLHLRHLSPDCVQLLRNAGDLVEVSYDDPDYRVADDKLA